MALAGRYMQQVCRVRPTWSPHSIKTSQITCALSNKIYCASHGNEKLLLRIYGSTDHGLFSRGAEVQQARFLSSNGFGPEVLHTFEEGRVEAWMQGRTPTHDEMRSPDAIRTIARKLRKLHEDAGVNHNDLHRNNMLFDEDGNIEFLDFEYSAATDATYDIANHFNEWMYPYSGENQHVPREELYPSLSRRKEFCANYLGLESESGKGAVIDDFVEQVERRREDSHAFWVEWAERSGPSEFNTLYAQARRALIHPIE